MSDEARKTHWGLIFFFVVALLLIGGLLRGSVMRLPGEHISGAPKVSLSLATNFASSAWQQRGSLRPVFHRR